MNEVVYQPDHILFFVLAGMQGIAFAIDEFYFHRRRGLPRWERWGHPVDTFFFLLPLVYLWIHQSADTLYLVLTGISCVMVTKDEFVHSGIINKAEHWLHAVLFVLHPAVLLSAAWTGAHRDPLYAYFLVGILLMMAFQVIYWNFIAPPHKPHSL